MNCCSDYGQCTQGQDCPVRSTYEMNFDRLGNPVKLDQVWRFADLARLALAAIFIAAAIVSCVSNPSMY